MFKKIILVCCAIVSMVGCNRSSQDSENNVLIPRDILRSYPDKYCASMNHAGDKIAYLARKGNGLELRVEDLSGNLIRKFDVKPCRDLYRFVWARTGEHILILQDNAGDENTHVLCLDIKTGASKDLTPFKGAKSEVAKISRKYPYEIIVSSNKNNPKYFDAYRVNIITGKTTLVFRNTQYSRLVFDNDLKLRLVCKMMPNGVENVYLMKNGKPEILRKVPFEDTKGTTISHFNTDNKIMYGLDSVGRDKSALVAYDLQRKTSKVIFENDLVDINSFIYDPKTRAPQGVVLEYLKQETFVIDKAIEKDIAYLKANSEGKNFWIRCRNDNDDTWLITYYGSDSCNKYYLYKRDAKKHEPISLKFLFSTMPKLDNYQLQKKEPVVIKSRDGFDLVCYLTKSADFNKADPRKLVAYVHGGPWMRDGDYLEPDVQLLANRGYSVLQINFRGSTGFGKKFTNAGNMNLDKVRNDIIDGVNWAIENKITDKKYVAIMGASFGGYATLSGLAFSPDVFCCGVDIFGMANMLTKFKTCPPYWIPLMEIMYKFYGDPKTKEGRELLWNVSPLSRVNDIKKPLIIFQGKNDARVNQNESDQIVNALKKKGSTVIYVLYSDEGHGFCREPNKKSYIAMTEIFLSKIMGGRFEPIHQGELNGSSHQILEGKEIIGMK